eukprot:m.138567 g.138567  ORF g.138567 m.138567 type:complete len:51 (-) comp30002_c0_seq1:563-715(-)
MLVMTINDYIPFSVALSPTIFFRSLPTDDIRTAHPMFDERCSTSQCYGPV